MRFTELAAVTGGKLLNDDRADQNFRGVSIDSRAVKPGELFIAIRGDKHDGHDYIEQAVGNGAAGVIAEISTARAQGITGDAAVVTVANSHQAMIEMAKQYRNSIDGRFVGITGSNGKTTTKELTFRLIKSVEPRTFCSPGNFNNLYGLPLSLFAVENDARVVVLEMGISTTGEMPQLAEIVRPDVIVITNVGPSHLEFLGTVEAVAQSKLELVRQAAAGVPVIINGDDVLLVRETKKVRRDFLTFALDSKADFTVDRIDVDKDGANLVTIEGNVLRLPLSGRHQVYNLLAAYATFRTLGYEFAGIDTGSLSLETAPMRGQRIEAGGITFLSDCYNANPDSVRAGLKAFFSTPTGGRRVVILGDMLELGVESERYHREVGRLLATEQFDKAVMVGEMSRFMIDEAVKAGADSSLFEHHDSAARAAERVREFLKAGDFVYVKGSRGVGLEVVLEKFGVTEE
ncbi:MAG: UDP-N-acetylmuramoyl-tripeptide--D-alanyl-D-alanine ligase [Candidatus Zixiibacteriota bacterium]|nr:MAG: UDP-N-acetylmuramoyl-tripeptide--D-alanyl-D-alanine ligase [candidate division Zixibacteria bacterium]